MNFQLQRLTKKANSFLRRFHLVLFVVVVLGGLAIAVYILSSILQDSSDTSSGQVAPSTLAPNFDQETIERLNDLRTSNENTGNISLPSGRINPFTE